MPSSISTEPTRVYRKNLIAAYSLRAPPRCRSGSTHRHQHHFPEHVEEEEVERHEDAQHPGLQQEQEDVVLLLPVVIADHDDTKEMRPSSVVSEYQQRAMPSMPNS